MEWLATSLKISCSQMVYLKSCHINWNLNDKMVTITWRPQWRVPQEERTTRVNVLSQEGVWCVLGKEKEKSWAKKNMAWGGGDEVRKETQEHWAAGKGMYPGKKCWYAISHHFS